MDGLALIRWIYTQSQNECVVTYHCLANDDVVTQANLYELGSATKDQWEDDAQTLLNTQVELTRIEAADLSPVGLATQILPSGQAGDRAGNPLDPVISLTVTKTTGLAGRKYRGRTYNIGGISTDLSGNGLQWDIEYATSWALFYDAWRSAIIADGDYTPVIYHRDTDTATPTDSHIGRTRLATQRRRIPGL